MLALLGRCARCGKPIPPDWFCAGQDGYTHADCRPSHAAEMAGYMRVLRVSARRLAEMFPAIPINR